MSLLLSPAPKSVTIGGAEVGIDTDFRTSIRFELMMQEDDAPEEQKLLRALTLYYGGVPQPIEEAVHQMLWFYRVGSEDPSTDGNGHTGQRIYSFEHDDAYIYAAFMAQYGIDLQSIPYLHWWSFKGLFQALSPENEFVKIMQYRAAEITPKMSPDQKQFYRKMKKLYALPLPKREKEQLSALEEALLNGGDVSALLGGDGHQ